MHSKTIIPAIEILESEKKHGKGNFIQILYEKRNVVSYANNKVIYLKTQFKRVNGDWVMPHFLFKTQILGSGAKLPYGVNDFENEEQISKVKHLVVVMRSFDEEDLRNFDLYSEMNDNKIKNIIKSCKLNSEAAISLQNEYRLQCTRFNEKFMKKSQNGNYVSIKSVDGSLTAKYTNMKICSPIQLSRDDEHGDPQTLKHPIIRLKLPINRKNNSTVSHWFRSNNCVPIVYDLSSPNSNNKGHKPAYYEKNEILNVYNAHKFITYGSFSNITMNSSDLCYSSQGISIKFEIKQMSMFSNPRIQINSNYDDDSLENEFGEDILKVINIKKDQKQKEEEKKEEENNNDKLINLFNK